MPARDPAEPTTDPLEDLWNVIGLPGAMTVASYLTSERLAPVYRLIVDVMLENQPQYLSGIPHDQLETLVRARLAEHLSGDDQTLAAVLDPEVLRFDGRLTQLAAWGVILAWEDRVRSDEDFTRHRGRYQLSEEAAQLHRAVLALGTTNASAIAATLAPPVIAGQLQVLASSIGTDAKAAAGAWAVIFPTMQNMSDAATGWQARLAAALSGTPDATKIAALDETLSGYVSMWGAGIDIYSVDIVRDATAVLAVEERAHRRVALHLVGVDASEEAVVRAMAETTDGLGRILAWFDGPTSQAASLRRQIRDTIVPLVRGKRVLAGFGGHVSRRAELLDLAERLDGAVDQDDLWRMWTTYTGLFSARHLGFSTPHPGLGAESMSFWDAAPSPIEARLRRQGPRAARGAPSRMFDRSAGKQAARQAAAAAAVDEARAVERLLELSGRPLSQWSNLSDRVAEHLIDFIQNIDFALARARREQAGPLAPGTAVHARTGDDLWDLVATVPAAGAPDAIIEIPAGRLVYPDLIVTVLRIDTLGLTSDAPPGPDPTVHGLLEEALTVSNGRNQAGAGDE
ncbi:DUF2397 domain-containing protein [Promicromonospora sp. MS192]|uniref:DUF2397 domain-containing protein n=1 Tax=Promicromonospora sp. MS192 TaxID=3412684 RepID=UPI003C2B5E57